MKLQGKITISRPTSNFGPDYINIRVQDNSSGIEFLDMAVTLTDFAQALTGLGFRPVEIETFGLEHVGKVCEHKQERVYIPGERYGKASEEVIAAAFAPLEIDGWMGSVYDAQNRKNILEPRAEGDIYSVGFTRYVPAPTHQ